MTADVHIGISGWSYKEWKNEFYEGVPQRSWLEHYAEHFETVEINATFYGMQSPKTLSRWVERTPNDFVFCAKAHRLITHTRRLHDVDEAVLNFRDNLATMDRKLHVVLWQFPASFKRNLRRLEHFADLLATRWSDMRHAIELRHPSWMDEEVETLLCDRNLGNCQSDAPDFDRWDAVTADFAYVRLHGRPQKYASQYDAQAIEHWAQKIERWRSDGLDTYLYFDNTMDGAAPEDAHRLLARLAPSNSPQPPHTFT